MALQGVLMKKVELSVTKQNNIDVIRYDLTPTDIYDEKVSDKVSQFSNIFPFQYSEEDGKKSVTSYVSESITLASLFKQVLNKKEVLCVLNGLISAFEIGAQGVPVSYIVKDFNYIYVNTNSYTVKCIVVPVKQDVMSITEIAGFFRDFMSHIKYSEEDNDNYVAKIITLINSDGFSNSKLKKIVDEYLEKMNLFISKDNGLTLMPDNTNLGTENNSVKVNKLDVMNNMQNVVNPQMQFGVGSGLVPGMSMSGQPMPVQPASVQPAPMPMPGMPTQAQPVSVQPGPMAGMPMPGQPSSVQPAPMPMSGMPMPGQPSSVQPTPGSMAGMPMPVQPMSMKPVSEQPISEQPVSEQPASIQQDNRPKPVLVRRKTGEPINITKSEFAIGKSQTSDYMLTDNPAISRIHCYIIQRNGVNYIKDNNSTNHTYLNDVQLQPGEEVLLKNKSIIKLGDEDFTFVLRKGE